MIPEEQFLSSAIAPYVEAAAGVQCEDSFVRGINPATFFDLFVEKQIFCHATRLSAAASRNRVPQAETETRLHKVPARRTLLSGGHPCESPATLVQCLRYAS